jgi:CRISPR-associated endonuclease Csy4
MDSYLDLTLRADPEFPQSQLLNALYAKLHHGLVSAQSNSIAIAFPKASAKSLGACLRLFAAKAVLQAFMAQPWLSGMRDHVVMSDVLAIPVDAKHRRVQRVQAKSSPERLRRRQMRRHGLSAEAAHAKIPDTIAQSLTEPFLQLSSASTGQRFRLFLRLGAIVAKTETGVFNSYGLSQTATVPWF